MNYRPTVFRISNDLHVSEGKGPKQMQVGLALAIISIQMSWLWCPGHFAYFK